MTGAEYKDALEELGLDLDQGARFLRMSPRLSYRIAAGDDYLQWARSALLRVMVTHRISVTEVERLTMDFNDESEQT